MSFYLLGSLLALAAYLVATLAGAGVVALVSPLALARLAGRAARTRAAACFVLALLPSTAGLLAALALVLPAWIAREPRASAERPGPLLWLLALSALALLVLRLGAGLRALCRGRRAAAEWTRRGAPLGGLPLAATRIEHAQPLAALSGLRRPRLLLAGRLLRALDPHELRAVVAHEQGHLAAGDNLRRLLLASAPDPLAWTPSGGRLRREFERAAEEAADRHACGLVPPLDLARALLKVAALVPGGTRLELPLAAFDDGGPLAARVRALLAAAAAAPSTERRRRWGHAAVLLGALTLGLAAAAVGRPEVHGLLEALVRH